MGKPTWKKEEFINSVKNSYSIREVLLSLGLDASSGNYRIFKKYKEKWNLDTSHFRYGNINNLSKNKKNSS